MAMKPFKIYSAESSIHGIPFFSFDIHISEKIFWAIATVISVICCLTLVGQIAVKVEEDLTVTYTSDISISVTKIPFPAVTLCFDLLSYGNYTYSKYHILKEELENNEISITDLTEQDLKSLQAISLIISDDFLLRYNVAQIPTEDMLDIIDEITLPIRKLIVTHGIVYKYLGKKPKYLGLYNSCQKPPIPKYLGIVFDIPKLYRNLEAVPKIFSYNHDILYMTQIEKYLRAPINPIKYNATNPLNLTTGDSQFQVRIAPKDKSMKYELDDILNTYDYYTFISPHIYINNPFEMYSKDVNSYFSNRGNKVLYFIDPKQTLIHETLTYYEADVRGCYFNADDIEHGEDERALKYFKIYTRGNCKQECLVNRTLEVCGCVQFFMIREEGVRVCGIHDMKCYQKVEAELDPVEYCKCYPYCGEIIYHVERVQNDFIKPVSIDIDDSYLEMSKGDKYDSLTVVKFRSSSYFPYMLKRQFTENDFIAYTGGAFGLFLGISILSFVEIFYYFTIRLLFAWMRERRKNKKVRGELFNSMDTARSKIGYIKYYFSISTVHGMNQIIMDNRNFLERMFWALCLGFSLLYCGLTSYEMYERFEKSTVTITYDANESPIENIPFPAIFLTPEISIPHVIVRMAWNLKLMGMPQSKHFNYLRYFNMLNRYLVSSLMCNYRFALDLIRPSGYLGIDNYIEIMGQYSTSYWFQNQTAILNEKFRPEFVEFLSQSGYGFSFNMMPPEKLYQANVSQHFSKIRKIIPFNISELSRDLQPISHESYPLNLLGSSEIKLTLTKNKYVPYKNLCQFLYFNIHSPFEFPGHYNDDRSNRFYYGQDLEVLITPDVIRSEEDLRTFTPEQRHCYFQGEKPLNFFKIYTRRNCEMECLAEYYMQNNETKCVPYYIIRNETMPVCPMEKEFDVIFRKYNFLQGISIIHGDSEPYINRCGCLDTCNDVEYHIEVMEKKINDEIKDQDGANITITFRFKDDNYLPLVRRISFTFDEFLCQAGGLLGLYAGISALSIVELLYFVTLRPLMNMLTWLMNKTFNK